MTSFGSPSATRSNQAATVIDHNVTQAGNDGISSLTWSPTSNILTSTNWDGGIRCWDVQDQNGRIHAVPKAQVNHENNAPVLGSTFDSSGNILFSVGADKAVRMWNLGQTPPNNVPQQIGVHNAPVKSVGFIPSSNLIVSGGWDKMLKFWDARSPNPVGQIELPERCYDLDVRGNLLVVACAGRTILSYEVQTTPREHSRKESPLKFQSRSIAAFPDMTGFAVGSIEGRVGIHYLQKVPNKDSFAFKCHRQNNDVYAVNAISFHSNYGTFATVGGDGVISFWDKDNKQRLKGFPAINRSISCANFNKQGNMFAYASSYDWSKGSSFYSPTNNQNSNEIFIHYVLNEEIQPKASRK